MHTRLSLTCIPSCITKEKERRKLGNKVVYEISDQKPQFGCGGGESSPHQSNSQDCSCGCYCCCYCYSFYEYRCQAPTAAVHDLRALISYSIGVYGVEFIRIILLL